MAVGYVLCVITRCVTYISEYTGWFSLLPLYHSPTYAKMSTAKYMSITRYLRTESWTGDDKHFGESLALQETFMRYNQEINHSSNDIYQQNKRSNATLLIITVSPATAVHPHHDSIP